MGWYYGGLSMNEILMWKKVKTKSSFLIPEEIKILLNFTRDSILFSADLRNVGNLKSKSGFLCLTRLMVVSVCSSPCHAARKWKNHLQTQLQLN